MTMRKRNRALAGRQGLAVLAAFAAPLSAAHAAPGEALFKERCQLCHTINPGGSSGTGPNLAGVVGRPAGSMPRFVYSPALQKSTLTWTKTTLDAFLTAPGKLVPGTRMVVSVPDPGKRADIVAYLGTLRR